MLPWIQARVVLVKHNMLSWIQAHVILIKHNMLPWIQAHVVFEQIQYVTLDTSTCRFGTTQYVTLEIYEHMSFWLSTIFLFSEGKQRFIIFWYILGLQEDKVNFKRHWV